MCPAAHNILVIHSYMREQYAFMPVVAYCPCWNLFLCSYIFQPNDEMVSCIRYMFPDDFRILHCGLKAGVCNRCAVHLFVMIYSLLMFTQARMDFRTQSHTELQGRCKVRFITRRGWSMKKAGGDGRCFLPSRELIFSRHSQTWIQPSFIRWNSCLCAMMQLGSILRLH